MDENRANIIVALVAVAAIVGLVSSFSGVNLGGLFHADTYPADSGIGLASQQNHAIGIDIGNACLQNWDVATQGSYDDCCPASCGAVCTDGNCFRECTRGCYTSVNAAFGY